MELKDGVYYLPESDKIVVLKDVEFYEDLFNPKFYIVTYIYEKGSFKKTLIRNEVVKDFKRIGEL